VHNQTNRIVLSERRPRELRNNTTDAEKKLWKHLRDRQVLGAKFRRQHALVDYIVDFVSFDAMLIVELDGSQHSEQAEYDDARDAALAKLGFKTLRVWNNELGQNLDGVMGYGLP
jgi:very-short-patch-repair endonuclease